MLRVISRHSRNFQKKTRSIVYKSNARTYSSGTSKKSGGGSGTLVTFGTLTLATGGAIAYAKYDKDFREKLVKYIPYSDDVIKFVFQEDSKTNLVDQASSVIQNVKKTIDDTISGGSKPAPEVQPIAKKKEPKIKSEKPYEAPPPIIPLIEKEAMNDPKTQYSEIRLEEGEDDLKPTVLDAKTSPTLPETHPKNLAELEKRIREAATEAVNAYNQATYKLKIYNSEVDNIITTNVDLIKPQTWKSLRGKTLEKDQVARDAEVKAVDAAGRVQGLKDILSKPTFTAPKEEKEIITLNVEKMQQDVNDAKAKFELEKKLGSISEKYWHKVEEARKHFAEQLEALFPTVDIKDKKLRISEDDLDLFLLHAYSNVLFYQKELAKMETINRAKLEAAVEAARKRGGDILTNAQICEAVEQEKRRLTLCFQQQCLKLRQDAEKELRDQLKRQSQCFCDHLEDEVKTKTMEIERDLGRKFDEDLECERTKYKAQLASVVGRLRGLDAGLKAKMNADIASKNSQVLWNACQALIRALKTGCPGIAWKQQLRPLDNEIQGVQKAGDKDDFVSTVVKSIPDEAKFRGVFPEDALRERFIHVEEIARNVALVPETGGSLFLYLLSYAQSFLLFKNPSPIPAAELNDEEIDFSDLNTSEILQRARYWLDRGNFLQTLRYMNLLQGAPRSVACQWMNETRILLETQQAAEALMAHAASSGYAAL